MFATEEGIVGLYRVRTKALFHRDFWAVEERGNRVRIETSIEDHVTGGHWVPRERIEQALLLGHIVRQ